MSTLPSSPLSEVQNPVAERVENTQLIEHVIQALKTVYDPEIPINIYDLGLIYHLAIEDNHSVKIQMTLTSPNCPEAQVLPGRVEQAAREVPGIEQATVTLVWDPPWTKETMSEEARLVLGMF